MRIVNFPAPIAVLLLTAIFFLISFVEPLSSLLSSQSEFSNSTNSKEFSSNQQIGTEEDLNVFTNTTASIYSNHHWMSPMQAENLLIMEGGKDMLPVDCCPSVTEMTAPKGGINAEGLYVQLYKDGDKRQQFYEISCKSEVLDQPCRFIEKRFHNRSRCVQKYSYSYAIVMQPEQTNVDPGKSPDKQFASIFPNQTEKYMLDYIQVRSGCTCEVQQNKKMRKVKKKKRKPSDI